MCGRANAAFTETRTHASVSYRKCCMRWWKTAKPGKRSVCIIPGGEIIPESRKQAEDALPEFILTLFVARI